MNDLGVPYLSRSAIAAEVNVRFRSHLRTFLAIYGTGEDDSVALDDGKGLATVIPVQSELDLRRKLPSIDESPRMAFLVPWRGHLPNDLAGRFVQDGRIYVVGPSAQLAALTGVQDAQDAANDPLAAYLLRPGNPRQQYVVASQVLRVKTLYEAWLRHDWELPIEDGLGRDVLLGWCAKDARGPRFAEEMQTEPAKGVRDGLFKVLREEFREVAVVIWKAWELGKGLEMLAFAVLAETLAPLGDSAVRMWFRLKLASIVGEDASIDANSIALDVALWARPAFQWLRKHAPLRATRCLEIAETMVDDDYIRERLATNLRLPMTWNRRQQTLANAFVEHAEKRSNASFEEVANAWQKLREHDMFWSDECARFGRQSVMLVRLAAFLVLRTDRALEAPPGNYQDAENLAAWYAKEGGFVDWARRTARAIQSGPLAAGASAIMNAADEVRASLDRRFAVGLQQWIAANRPSVKLVPLDHALARFAVPFLRDDDQRSLLVVLMDGMAWSQAAQLIVSLSENGQRWAPLVVQRPNFPPNENPAVIAMLPTVTEVSRSAFFAGRPMQLGANLASHRDNELFAAHKDLQRFCAPNVKPKLLLRNDGMTDDGSLTQEARTMIASVKESRVVGIVVNAIDASLSGDIQIEYRWSVDDIRPVYQIFDAAAAAGRHILLVADHGHVPADRLKPIGILAGGGARWRPWAGDSKDTLKDGELKVSGDGVWLPKGAEAIVALTDDCQRYGNAAHAGEHGGASLAEAVVPCVLLGYESADSLTESSDLRALRVPDWWSASLPSEVKKSRQPKPSSPATKKPKQESTSQQAMLTFEAPTSAPSQSSSLDESTPNPIELFLNCSLLKVRAPKDADRKLAAKAVEYLLDHSLSAPQDAFASHLGVLPFRAQGIVSKLQEILNVDGYEVLEFERKNQRVVLHRDRLEQQFEVSL